MKNILELIAQGIKESQGQGNGPKIACLSKEDLPEELKKVLSEIKGKAKAQTEAPEGLFGILSSLSKQMEAEKEEMVAELETLEKELNHLVGTQAIPSYTIFELYDKLKGDDVAIMLDAAVVRVRLQDGELIDNDGDILPAFRTIIEAGFVLESEYKAYKQPKKETKKDKLVMVSKEVAFNAFEHGADIQVEFTDENGEVKVITLYQNKQNVMLPMQAILDGVFYIIQK